MNKIDFDDESKFVTVGPVFILDSHVLRNEKGEVELSVDEQFLNDIANNNNRRIERTGDAPVLSIGHTSDDDNAPEESQPRVVGFASDFQLLPFFDTGKKGLACMFRVYKKDYDEGILDRYPRRSIELWINKRECDPISLLGPTCPERDLGPLIRYSRDNNSISYSFPNNIGVSMPVNQNVKLKYEAVEDKPEMKDAKEGETSSMKKLEAEVAQLRQMLEMLLQVIEGGDSDDQANMPSQDQMPPTDDKAPMMDQELPPQHDDLLGPVDQPAKDERKLHEGNPVKFSVEQSNTYIPSENTKKMSRTNDKSDDVVKLSRYETENAKLHKELNDLKLKYARTEAEKTLNKLLSEGYVIDDMNEEADILSRLSDTAKEKYIERIKKNYKRAPITNDEGPVKYARQQVGQVELTYDQALECADSVSRGLYKTLDDAAAKMFGKTK